MVKRKLKKKRKQKLFEIIVKKKINFINLLYIFYFLILFFF